MRKLLLMLVTFSACAVCPARAVVVFGNLGSDGSGGLNASNTDIEFDNLLTQGFATGASSLLALDSITLGLFGVSSGTIDVTIGLYSDAGGIPGSLLYSATTAVGAKAKYAFDFNGAILSPGQAYWVVPDPVGTLAWYFNNPESHPTEQNLSGFSYVGTLKSTNGGTIWTTADRDSYSISITATEIIPEPGTWAVAVLLCGAAALVARRRAG